MTFINSFPVNKTLFVAIVAACMSFGVAANDAVNRPMDVDMDMLSSVKRLYGLNTQEAVDRYIAEEAATDLYRRVQSLAIPGYAGAWFDADTEQLHVASSDPIFTERITRLGAVVRDVSWSLDELEALRTTLREEDNGSGLWEKTYVDYKNNRLVVGIRPERIAEANIILQAHADKVDIYEELHEVHQTVDIRGADGTRNSTWESKYGGSWPCSIGFGTENGFYTAGHCGAASNDIHTAGGAPIGVVQISALPYTKYAYQKDTAWVNYSVGWSPTSKINGYSDGVLNVPEKWAGTSVSPIGTTVCRYGQTSGGPHCGVVNQFNVTTKRYTGPGAYYYIEGLTEVSGSCTNDGDSGGSWIGYAGGQAQGVNYGGTTGNTCPTPTVHTYFQPISDHIKEYETTAGRLLTTHGAAVPSVSGFSCPNMSASGMGEFFCNFNHYNSQGSTSVSWTGTGLSWSSDDSAYGTCNAFSTVIVTLTVTNPYGSYVSKKTFDCPMGPIP